MLAVCEGGVPSWMAEAARGEHTIPRNITQERAGEMARDLSDMEGRVCPALLLAAAVAWCDGDARAEGNRSGACKEAYVAAACNLHRALFHEATEDEYSGARRRGG